MVRFEEGKSYEAGHYDLSHIKVIKRTAKTCLVVNADGVTWRMKIRTLDDSEIMIDSSVPEKWREAFTYYAKYEAKEV